MDINNQNYLKNLPFLLEDVANATFVSIDLEYSGIPGSVKRTGHGSLGLPTLQERYTDIKKAAEQYQILQVGLTFAMADMTEGIAHRS